MKLFSGADRTICDVDVVRMCRPGRPKMLRKKSVEKDCRHPKRIT